MEERPPNRWLYYVADGSYEAPTLWGVLWLIIRHRAYHFMRGDGWRD